MAVVQTKALTKVFKERSLGAVNHVDLETQEGEFLVLLGPSGSGKTTLLRMIAGLEQPTSGEILIGGRVVNHLSPRERKIAMVFQSYALYPHLTAYGNIAFPLKAQKVPREQHRKKVEWAASLLGINSLLDRKPRQLSGGERQRVALARAIVREPLVFLIWMPNCAPRPAKSLSNSTSASRPPLSTSPMTKWKQWPWAIAWWCCTTELLGRSERPSKSTMSPLIPLWRHFSALRR
jgi:ABC-type Fe3+/spermidine/putrescine transport system ATPase subunit